MKKCFSLAFIPMLLLASCSSVSDIAKERFDFIYNHIMENKMNIFTVKTDDSTWSFENQKAKKELDDGSTIYYYGEGNKVLMKMFDADGKPLQGITTPDDYRFFASFKLNMFASIFPINIPSVIEKEMTTYDATNEYFMNVIKNFNINSAYEVSSAGSERTLSFCARFSKPENEAHEIVTTESFISYYYEYQDYGKDEVNIKIKRTDIEKTYVKEKLKVMNTRDYDFKFSNYCSDEIIVPN
ncbi:MAG: hypothetical protein RRZ92_03405 [Bacilli bacterium]